MGRYGGQLSTVRPDDLAAVAVGAVVERAGIEPADVDDVILGCANQAGEDNRERRADGGAAGRLPGRGPRPDGQPAVRVGAAGAAIAARARSGRRGRRVRRRRRREHEPGAVRDAQARDGRSRAAPRRSTDTALGWRFVNPQMVELGHTDSLGETAENVARATASRATTRTSSRGGASATRSAAQARACWPRRSWRSRSPGARATSTVVDADEHPRADAELERLREAAAGVRDGGTVTAGNASPLNDGAAALLLMSGAEARAARPVAAGAVRRRRRTPASTRRTWGSGRCRRRASCSSGTA